MMYTIQQLLAVGFEKHEIEQYMRENLPKAGFSNASINEHLAKHGIIGEIREDTFLRRASNALRGSGKYVGSSAGSMIAGHVAPGPLKPAAMLAGGYLGGGMGESAEALIRGEGQNTLQGAFRQAHQGGMAGLEGELLGHGAGAVASKAISPFAGSFQKMLTNNPTARTAQDLVEQGYPISPDIAAPARRTRAAQKVADVVYPGKFFADRRRQGFMKMLTAESDSLIKDTGLPRPTSEPGRFMNASRMVFNQMKKVAGGDSAPIAIDNARRVILDTLERRGNLVANDPYWTETLANLAQKEEVTFGELMDIAQTVWPKGRAFTKLTSPERGLRGEVLSAIKDDITAFDPKVFKKFTTAREVAKMSRQVGASRYVEKGLISATDYVDGEQVFYPLKFKKWFDRSKHTLRKILSGQQYDDVMAFAEKSRLAIADQQRLLSGSKLSLGTSLRATAGVGTGGAIVAKPYLAVPAAFHAWFADSLMKPSGMVRRFLTTGFPDSSLPKLVKEVSRPAEQLIGNGRD